MVLRYRLGLDVGTNSLGWSVIRLNHNGYPEALQDAGVRIFSDGRAPKTGTSLAAERTAKRGARRRRDRFVQRRKHLLDVLAEMHLLPADLSQREALKTLDPYQLRAEALDKALTPYELGRALIHLNQRRGFKSNRKEASDALTDTQTDIQKLRDELAKTGARTLGEFLFRQRQAGKPTRARKGEGLYPERKHYADEFDRIREKQQPHHPAADWDKLENVIFHQRDLAPQPKGRCQLMYKDKTKTRAYRALPSAELFTLLQNMANLGWRQKGSAAPYTMLRDDPALWDKLYEKLSTSQGGMKFSAISKLLFGKAEQDTFQFNLETDRRDKLEGLPTAYLMHKGENFGSKWGTLGLAEQDRIISTLLETQDPEDVKKLSVEQWGLSNTQAENLAKLDDSKFASGTARFCAEALHGLVERMQKRMTYWDAAQAMGYDPRGEFPDHERYDELPYYAEALPDVAANSGDKRTNMDEKDHGIIGNPTVHIALNQIRHVVNDIIKTHGKPEGVHIELARTLKLNGVEKSKLESEQRKNQKENEDIAKDIERINREHGSNIQNTYANRLRFKLWEEQKKANNDTAECPFSGQVIGPSSLFTDKVEIEHILPFALTLDDNPANKVLATREANRKKGRRTPFEAFANATDNYAYDLILGRTKDLPKNKAWRFAPEAMEKFADENSFLARQMTDTQYIAKVAHRYLSCICPREKVISSPGRLTAKLRHMWGLNSLLNDAATEKDRTDHRHHAIDAVVIALTDRKLLQDAIKANKERAFDDDKLLFPCPLAVEDLREQAQTVIDENLVVSHRPDHSNHGQLHEDSNYGLLKPQTKWEHEKAAAGYNLVIRKSLEALSEGEIHDIRDPLLREELEARLQYLPTLSNKPTKEEKKSFNDALKRMLAVFVEERARAGISVRTVRILKKDNSALPIRHISANGKEHVKYVAPGEIHHVSFWEMPRNSTLRDDLKNRFILLKSGLIAQGVSFFEASQKNANQLKPHPAAKLVMKLHKGDMIQLMYKGALKIAKITSLKPSNQQVFFLEHVKSVDAPPQSSFRFNAIGDENWQIRKIALTPSGKIIHARSHY